MGGMGVVVVVVGVVVVVVVVVVIVVVVDVVVIVVLGAYNSWPYGSFSRLCNHDRMHESSKKRNLCALQEPGKG